MQKRVHAKMSMRVTPTSQSFCVRLFSMRVQNAHEGEMKKEVSNKSSNKRCTYSHLFHLWQELLVLVPEALH